MKISISPPESSQCCTSHNFEDYLKCPTKCWLRFHGEEGAENSYSNWARKQNDAYRIHGLKRLTDKLQRDEYARSSSQVEKIKTAKWKLAVDFDAKRGNLQSCIHAVERVPSNGQDKPIQFIPIRFIFTNKLTKEDKLQVVFDALVLSETIGNKVSHCKIIHGEDYVTSNIKTTGMMNEVNRTTVKLQQMLSNNTPPHLILNKHCIACEYKTRCRHIAIEKDDLSLLSGMSEKERKKFNGKGIFTVTHLSYTFRPRRKSKRFSGKQENYHQGLKALAIREHKVHVVGSNELRIGGIPVYLDVEGIPDRNSYYLIGIRVITAHAPVQYSLWADTKAAEKNIWSSFIDILSAIHDPIIVHYGSFETTFLKQMCNRYGGPPQESNAAKAISNPINLLSFIFARFYFPTHSNGLKDIAKYLGFTWSESDASGIRTILWRTEWEGSQQALLKQKLITYNTEDCEALNCVADFVGRASQPQSEGKEGSALELVHADCVPPEGFFKFRKNEFQLAALEDINRSAYWDYQREKIVLRSDKRLRKIHKTCAKKAATNPNANIIIQLPAPQSCPRCNRRKLYKHAKYSKEVLDIRFGRSSIKRWVTKYEFYYYRCPACGAVFPNSDRPWGREKYGKNLLFLSMYLNIHLRIPQIRIAVFLNQIIGLNLARNVINKFKAKTAMLCRFSYEGLLRKIVTGKLVHADETRVNVAGKVGYVWAFANLEEVVYVYAPSREGDLVQTLLKDFKGVLVTDFYTAYESINCPQQKCLIHLIRDLNDDLMKEPFNVEYKELISEFADLLKSIIETVDRFGLKTRFLRKHKIDVQRFFKRLSQGEYQTETAANYKKRFEKNRTNLFTFLDYDGVPWNNNNAEHAIKAIALLRRDIGGVSTENGIKDYLILLSVCETCRFKGVNFLDFLRSGEKDIDAFADRGLKRRRSISPAPLLE